MSNFVEISAEYLEEYLARMRKVVDAMDPKETWWPTRRYNNAMRALAILMLAGAAFAAPEGWHTSMKDGLAAAKKSRKPMLVVTLWKDNQ